MHEDDDETPTAPRLRVVEPLVPREQQIDAQQSHKILARIAAVFDHVRAHGGSALVVGVVGLDGRILHVACGPVNEQLMAASALVAHAQLAYLDTVRVTPGGAPLGPPPDGQPVPE